MLVPGQYQRTINSSGVAVHLVWCQHLRKALSQRTARLVAEVAVIGVTILVGKLISANDFCRAADQ